MTEPALPQWTTPVTTVEEVIARMESIDQALAGNENDGLACFNRMYLDVTKQVNDLIQKSQAEAAEAGGAVPAAPAAPAAGGTGPTTPTPPPGPAGFADPAFLAHLDAVFANLYFDAVAALATGAPDIPAAWQPLLEKRLTPGIARIQFALAGMNAHINHDLPVAVVSTCNALSTKPDEGTHHADYQRVDVLLDAAETTIRQEFESGEVLEADKHHQAVVNVLANWTMNGARDVAWSTALVLWDVQDHPLAQGLLMHALGRTVAMASRCLLIAAP